MNLWTFACKDFQYAKFHTSPEFFRKLLIKKSTVNSLLKGVFKLGLQHYFIFPFHLEFSNVNVFKVIHINKSFLP